MMFRLHDVGGQRSDRRKWLKLFDCVHAVVFCVDSTSYLQIRNGISVILESLQLFSAIVNSKIFIDAAMIAFLSKIDIFQVLKAHSGTEKLKKSRPKKLMKSNKSISRNIFFTKFHFLQYQKWPNINF